MFDSVGRIPTRRLGARGLRALSRVVVDHVPVNHLLAHARRAPRMHSAEIARTICPGRHAHPHRPALSHTRTLCVSPAPRVPGVLGLRCERSKGPSSSVLGVMCGRNVKRRTWVFFYMDGQKATIGCGKNLCQHLSLVPRACLLRWQNVAPRFFLAPTVFSCANNLLYIYIYIYIYMLAALIQVQVSRRRPATASGIQVPASPYWGKCCLLTS